MTSFTGTIKPTYDLLKHCNSTNGKRITGRALLVSTSPYAIVDIDIKHDDKQEIRDMFSSIIESNNITAVQTGSGGYHFYTLFDNSFTPTKDSYTKIYSRDEFDVDLFVPFSQEGKVSRCVLLPESKAKNKHGYTGTYKLVKHTLDEELLSFSDFKDVLYNELNITFSITPERTNQANHQAHNQDHHQIDEIDELYETFMNQCSNKNFMTKDLFDVLVKGFDETIEIHNDAGSELETEVAIYHVITALNACENSNITRDVIEEAIDYVYDHATLTDKAKSNWYKQIRRYKNEKADHYGGLFTIIKLYNPDYYKQHVQPLLKSKSSSPNDFLRERYTISDYKAEKLKFTSFDDYVNNLVKCIAFVDNGTYIIKEKDEDRVVYSVIDDTKLKKVLNFKGVYTSQIEVTEDLVEKARKNHKKLPGKVGDVYEETKEISMMKLLMNNDIQSKFKRFVKADLIGDDKEVFGLYRPPKPSDYYIPIKNKPELVNKFLTLINDQLFDEHAKEAFSHFINVNAYLLQYQKKASVFFVKYSSTGNTGKNYIDNAFSRLYHGFTLNGITDQQMKEKHNGGMINMLYRSYDEFENSNYIDKSINDKVKRLTNQTIAGRSMNTDTKEAKNFAIDVLNTNDPGIYGMIGTKDKALLSRLCIVRLKERDIRASQYARDMDVIDDKNFAYSLYTYLMNIDLTDFVKQQRYNRYPLDKTTVVTKQLSSLKSSILDEFLDEIYDLFEQRKYKGEQVDVISCSVFKDRYNYYMQQQNGKYKLTTNLDAELEERGIHKIKSMKFRGQVINVYIRTHVEREVVEPECFDDESGDGLEEI